MSERITVTIEPGGEVKVEVDGVEGHSCEAITKPFRQMGSVTSDRKKPEFYAAQQDEQTEAARQ